MLIFINLNVVHSIESKILKFGIIGQKYLKDNVLNSNLTAGFLVGFSTQINFNSYFVFQPEILLNFNSIEFDGDVTYNIDNDEDGLIDEEEFDLLDNDGDGMIDEDMKEFFCNDTGRTSFINLEMPFLLKFKIPSQQNSKFSIYTGSSIDLIVNGNYESNIYNAKLEGDFTRDKLGFNVIVGADYIRKNLIFDLRISESLFENQWTCEVETNGYGDFGEIIPENYYDVEMGNRRFSITFSVGIIL